MIFASIPSPAQSEFQIGPLTFHYYALCIIAGVIVAIQIGNRRYIARGGAPGVVSDIAIYAVPAGVIGGRLYHVITSPSAYFGKGGDPVAALYIWRGGLGIWGAIALGFFAAYLAYQKHPRRGEIPFAVLADSLAPALLFAQAIGRFGNWFNRELYGRPLHAPWALDIPGEGTFHPVFLYESIWCVLVAIFLIRSKWVRNLPPGSLFALYVALYSFGRGFIETIRIDDATHIFGLRLNIWTSVALFIGATLYIRTSQRRRTKPLQ